MFKKWSDKIQPYLDDHKYKKATKIAMIRGHAGGNQFDRVLEQWGKPEEDLSDPHTVMEILRRYFRARVNAGDIESEFLRSKQRKNEHINDFAERLLELAEAIRFYDDEERESKVIAQICRNAKFNVVRKKANELRNEKAEYNAIIRNLIKEEEGLYEAEDPIHRVKEEEESDQESDEEEPPCRNAVKRKLSVRSASRTESSQAKIDIKELNKLKDEIIASIKVEQTKSWEPAEYRQHYQLRGGFTQYRDNRGGPSGSQWGRPQIEKRFNTDDKWKGGVQRQANMNWRGNGKEKDEYAGEIKV